MAINFPSTPTLGQVMLVGNKAYAWNGKGWEIPTSPAGGGGGGGGASVTTDDNPPAIPKDGDMWLKTTTGVLYVYYDDGNSQQWIQVAASPQIVGKKNTANRYNMVVNGALNVSQENGNTESNTTGYFAADQMYNAFLATSAATGFSRVAVANLSGSQYRLQMRVTTAKAALAAGDFLAFGSSLEGLNIQDLGWSNAASQKDAVLTFGFNGPAGTYNASIRNWNGGAATYSFNATFTITAGQAGVDTVQTIKVPAPSGMTSWATDNTRALILYVTLAAGSTWLGAAGWSSGSFFGVAGMSNGLAAVQTFQIWDIGLYADPDKTGLAPPFEIEDYGTTLAKCMRYYQTYAVGSLILSGYSAATATVYGTFIFQAPMRIAPTQAAVGAVYSNGSALALGDGNSPNSSRMHATMLAGGMYVTYGATLNARM